MPPSFLSFPFFLFSSPMFSLPTAHARLSLISCHVMSSSQLEVFLLLLLLSLLLLFHLSLLGEPLPGGEVVRALLQHRAHGRHHLCPQSTYIKEYHSVCPLVGIGTLPTPLSPAGVPLPPNSQFRRLEKKLITLPTLCLFIVFFGGLECVGHSIDDVVHLWFLRDVWIRTSNPSPYNLASHPPKLSHHPSVLSHPTPYNLATHPPVLSHSSSLT